MYGWLKSGLHPELISGLVKQNASLPPFCPHVFAESQNILPGIASVLFPLQPSVWPIQSQSVLPSRPTSLMPDLPSLTSFTSTTPTATSHDSVVKTRKLGDHVHDPPSYHTAPDSNSTDQARHAYTFAAFMMALITLLSIIIVAGIFIWRRKYRRHVVNPDSSMHASHVPREMEGQHLLPDQDWIREVYGPGGSLSGLAKETRGYDEDEHLDGPKTWHQRFS